MQCQFCGNEVSSADQRFTCPACEFPLDFEPERMVSVKSERTSVSLNRSLRVGSISLSKVPELCTRRMLSVVFALDGSGSMQGKKAREAAAGLKLLVQSLVPLGGNCRFGVVEFNDAARVALQLACPAEAQDVLQASDPHGTTNIADGFAPPAGCYPRMSAAMRADSSCCFQMGKTPLDRLLCARQVASRPPVSRS